MDHNLPPSRQPQPHRSPRREGHLQGPRPSPLGVSKGSHVIMKPPPQPREPVIIYTISPKVIHVEPANFMDLVQRLTGPNRAGADLPMASTTANVDVHHHLERPAAIPGILSTVPASLPQVLPVYISPSSLNPSFHNFIYDMSPAGFQVSRPSPGSFVSPSIGLSPGALVWDIFNQFLDH